MNPKYIQLACFVVVIAMGAAYLLYLVACWNQMQKDRSVRDTRLDQVLDLLSKRKADPPLVVPE